MHACIFLNIFFYYLDTFLFNVLNPKLLTTESKISTAWYHYTSRIVEV